MSSILNENKYNMPQYVIFILFVSYFAVNKLNMMMGSAVEILKQNFTLDTSMTVWTPTEEILTVLKSNLSLIYQEKLTDRTLTRTYKMAFPLIQSKRKGSKRMYPLYFFV